MNTLLTEKGPQEPGFIGPFHVIVLFTFLALLTRCGDYGDVEVSQGIDSQLESSLYEFYSGHAISRVGLQIGLNLYHPESANWHKRDDFIVKLMATGISSDDSVKFINLDSTRQMVFINPIVDDSVDFKAKRSTHFWNIDNWYATKDAVYYLLTTENFERFAEEI